MTIPGDWTISEGGDFGAPRPGTPAGVHQGVDHPLRVGTPIPAFRAGRVEWYGWDSYELGGLMLRLRYPDGYSALYAHLERVLVEVGMGVLEGHTVALSGNSGSATTGPHLHHEVRDGANTPIDPIDYYAEEDMDEETVKQIIRAMFTSDEGSNLVEFALMRPGGFADRIVRRAPEWLEELRADALKD